MIVKADAKVECEIGEDDNPIEKRKLHGTLFVELNLQREAGIGDLMHFCPNGFDGGPVVIEPNIWMIASRDMGTDVSMIFLLIMNAVAASRTDCHEYLRARSTLSRTSMFPPADR